MEVLHEILTLVERFMKLTRLIFLAGAISLTACEADLSKEEENEAKSLVLANVMCEVLANYRLSTPKLKLMAGNEHKIVARDVYEKARIKGFYFSDGAPPKSLEQLRSELYEAIKEDLQKVSQKFGNERSNMTRTADAMFEGLQVKAKKDYGYWYSDCQMAYSIAENFSKERR